MKCRSWIVAAALAAQTVAVPVWATTAAKDAAPKVLLVVSSEGRDAGKTRPGFEMDEFAQAWLILRANGLTVEVASPAGGAPEADKYNKNEDYNRAVLADTAAMEALRNTRRTQDVKPGEHAAIFVMGGKGAMFDLPKDPALASLLAAQAERGDVVAGVCHGPAAFATAKLKDGTPMVKGRRMTGFSNEEEKVFGKKWVKEFPFLLETRMREAGAKWEEASLMMPKTVVDGRFITGQNPFSTAQVAEAIVKALGRTPVPRTPFREEASMQLAERWLAEDRAAVTALLAAAPGNYKTELIAMLGYYQFKSAEDDALRRQGLSLMLLAEPHFDHEQLKLGIAEAQIALGQAGLARERLGALLAKKPEHAEAKQLLASLAAR